MSDAIKYCDDRAKLISQREVEKSVELPNGGLICPECAEKHGLPPKAPATPIVAVASALMLAATSSAREPGDRQVRSSIYYPPAAFVHTGAGGRVFDITREPFNAVGDGKTDDTRAFVEMMNTIAQMITKARSGGKETATINNFVFVPNGTYLVSDTITYTGKHVPRGFCGLRVIGQDRTKTIIKLRNSAPGFGPGAKKPVITWVRDIGTHQGNVAWGNEIRNVTIDTGTGNPGATGAVFLGANTCCITDLSIVSGDGRGHVGLHFPTWSVQGHFRDITVRGFDYGIRVDHKAECNPVLEHVTLVRQNKAGIYVDRGSPCIRMLHSKNVVPALTIRGQGAHVVIVDSHLQGGGGGSAIELRNATSHLFARDVAVTGYPVSIAGGSKGAISGDVDEYVSGRTYRFDEDSPKRSMRLPVEDAPPTPWEHRPAMWATPEDYEGGDEARIRRALSSGKPAICFPKVAYCQKRPVGFAVGRSVRQIDFMHSSIWAGFNVSQASDEPLWIDHSGGRMTINVQAKRTVIIRYGGMRFECSTGEPVTVHLQSLVVMGHLPRFCPKNLRIYARSINNEDRKRDNFNIDGGLMWVLGYKTEAGQPSFTVRNGGVCEVLGGYRNQAATEELGRPQLLIENGHISYVGFSNMFREYKHAIWDTQGDQKLRLARTDMPARADTRCNFHIPLYLSYDPAAVPKRPPSARELAAMKKKGEQERAEKQTETIRTPPRARAVAALEQMWTGMLRRRTIETSASGEAFSFFASLTRSKVNVLSVGEEGVRVDARGVTMDIAWDRLTAADKLSIAKAIAREDSEQDNAVAAFFARAAGSDEDARAHLAAAGSYASDVEMSFE